MKIVFVVDKCFNIYRQRTFYNLVSLMGDRHDIQYIKPQNNLYKKLQEMKPDILYLIVGGREHTEILEIFSDKGIITVSDTWPGADVYINGESEQVFPALVEALENGKDLSDVPGITYKHRTKPAEKWDISGIKPLSGYDTFLTFSTRGCKGKCSFCNVTLRDGALRFRNIPEMIAEVKSFSNTESFTGHFRFADPSFDSNTPERMKEIARAIIKELPGHTYEANFRPDFHKIADDELMGLLQESGLTTVFIGVEAGNEEDLQLYNKGTTVPDAEKTIELFRRYDCFVDSGFIALNPWSTFSKLRENLAFLEKNRLVTWDNLTKKLTLSPGLPIKQKIVEDGLLYGNSYDVKDPGTKALMIALNEIEHKLNAKALEIYSCLSTNEAKWQKRIALYNNDAEAYAIAAKYEMLMQSVIMLESDLLAEWFGGILNMVEKLKPLEEIKAMSNRYLNDERLKTIIKYFKALESSMIREINELYASRKEADQENALEQPS